MSESVTVFELLGVAFYHLRVHLSREIIFNINNPHDIMDNKAEI